MILLNFYSAIVGQNSLFSYFMKDGFCYPKDGNLHHTLLICWVFTQVIIFYSNFISQLLFILITRLCRIYSFKEKLNVAGNMRKNMDYLEFFSNDICWFTFQLTQLIVFFIVHQTHRKFSSAPIPWSIYLPLGIRWLI